MSHHIHLILGASSAVARHMAEIYASEGDDLILAGRDLDDLTRTASHLSLSHKINACALKYDSTARDTHLQFIEDVKEKASGMTLNIVALTANMPEQDVMDKDVSVALNCIDTGFTGLVSVLHPLADYMEEQKAGSMILFGSVAGDRGRIGNYVYGATKAALDCYGSGLRNRLARAHIHVTTVKPGFIDTVMTRGMKLPPLPVAKPRYVAKKVIKAHKNKRNVLYVPFFWWIIMTIIKHIPEFIFKKMRF